MSNRPRGEANEGFTRAELKELRDFYRVELLENILPFWLRHAQDKKCGGYNTCLNRDGSVYDYDKICMWHAGRIIWTFSHLYNELEQRTEWLEMARRGVEFVQKYAFAPDGTMYYGLTREGRPLQAEQDVYNELSTVCGFTEFSRATSDESLYRQARDIFLSVWARLDKPGRAFQPFDPNTRPVRMHGHSMIPLGVLQELRRYRDESDYETMIDQCVRNLRELHLRPESRSLLEMVGWNGETLPGSVGRWACPGHMIEAGIFVIHEGKHRDRNDFLELGVDLIDWGYELGWDEEFGGIFNDVDLEGLPEPGNDVFKRDAKLWWQHAEALYGLLLAYDVTDDAKFTAAHRRVHDYSFERFADPEYGEWFAFLDRRGNCIGEAKGTSRKNTFHIGRNLYWCYRLLNQIVSSD